jgi:hypothetical protein
MGYTKIDVETDEGVKTFEVVQIGICAHCGDFVYREKETGKVLYNRRECPVAGDHVFYPLN